MWQCCASAASIISAWLSPGVAMATMSGRRSASAVRHSVVATGMPRSPATRRTTSAVRLAIATTSAPAWRSASA
jgi:hypothetical protein